MLALEALKLEKTWRVSGTGGRTARDLRFISRTNEYYIYFFNLKLPGPWVGMVQSADTTASRNER